MIELTRLNKTEYVLNAEMIKFLEETPDTVITLVSGEKLLVLEPIQEIMEKVIAYKKKILTWPGSNEKED